jgi:hypothetical protein
MENQINQIIENEEKNEPITHTAETDYLPLIIGELLTNESMDWGKIQDEINKNADEYGLTPIAICKKSSYTQAHKKAQQKYREKFPEKYNDAQRKLYEDKKKDDEWKQKFNERSRVNNQKYRERKKKEIIESGGVIKSKGRPRKKKIQIIDVPKMNINNIELKNEQVEKPKKERVKKDNKPLENKIELKNEIVMIDEQVEKPKRERVKKDKKLLENKI